MAYTGKTLATGWARSFMTIAYEPSASVVIKQLHFTNTGSASTLINVYHRESSGDEWVLWFQNPSIGVSEAWTPFGSEGDIPLSAGNQLAMSTTNEREVFFRILGAEFS